MRDQRRTDAAFMGIVFIQSPGRVARIGPSRAIADHSIRVPHGSRMIGIVQNVRRGLRSQINPDARLNLRRIDR